MEYTSEKLQDQNLLFRITTENNGEKVTFNVVCANDESEIEELIQVYLDYLNNPQPITKQEPEQAIHETIQEQQTLILALTARLDTLENKP